MDLVGTGSELEHDDSSRFCWHKGLPPLEGIVTCFLLQFIFVFLLLLMIEGHVIAVHYIDKSGFLGSLVLGHFAFSLAIGRMENILVARRATEAYSQAGDWQMEYSLVIFTSQSTTYAARHDFLRNQH